MRLRPLLPRLPRSAGLSRLPRLPRPLLHLTNGTYCAALWLTLQPAAWAKAFRAVTRHFDGTIAQPGEQPPCKRKMRVRFPLAPPALAAARLRLASQPLVAKAARRSCSEDGLSPRTSSGRQATSFLDGGIGK